MIYEANVFDDVKLLINIIEFWNDNIFPSGDDNLKERIYTSIAIKSRLEILL